MGGLERGQPHASVVNLHRIAKALGVSLSEFFAEVESVREQGAG
jgi:transcriptional regulator with XRE-family HTH domain